MFDEDIEDIVDNIDISVIIWDNFKDPICIYFNKEADKRGRLKNGMRLSSYLNNVNSELLEDNYYVFMLNHNDTKFVLDGNHCLIYKLDDNTFYEICVLNNTKFDSNLLSYINKRIRKPLTNIVGYVELLADTRLNREQKGYLNKIMNSTKGLVSLANDLLDLINLEKGAVKLFIEVNDVTKCVTESLKIVSNYVEKDKIVFKMTVNIDYYEFDYERLKQILVNMITNSARNTYEGVISIKVELNEGLLITIKDTGDMINLKQQGCMNYLLGNNDNKSLCSLGCYDFRLLISRYLCELMGGNISFVSDESLGNTYKIKINNIGYVLQE